MQMVLMPPIHPKNQQPRKVTALNILLVTILPDLYVQRRGPLPATARSLHPLIELDLDLYLLPHFKKERGRMGLRSPSTNFLWRTVSSWAS